MVAELPALYTTSILEGIASPAKAKNSIAPEYYSTDVSKGCRGNTDNNRRKTAVVSSPKASLCGLNSTLTWSFS
jgi:hypothetical protein